MPYQGIYAIVNLVHGGVYIGSSVQVYKRYDDHVTELKKGVHCNKKLQAAWNKYGEDNFVLGLIEEVPDKEKLLEIEQYWIDRGGYYNIAKIAGAPPNQSGQIRSPATKEKLQRPRKPLSEEHKENLSKALKGKKNSPEAIAKAVAKLKGRKA